jgi:hypothetical protein
MSEAHCPRCSNPLVSIKMTIGGERRTMCSCSRCDFRSWYAGEHPAARRKLALEGVLAEISDERRAQMQRR